MAPKRRTRTNSKINQLPEEVRYELIDQIKDVSITYEEISEWLNELGYDISRSAVGRFALQINETAKRVSDSIEQTLALTKAIERNPELDYSSAPRLLMLQGLTQRVSTADNDFLEMPLDKAGRLISSLGKDELRKLKNNQEKKSKMEIAYDQMEVELLALIKGNEDLSKRLQSVLTEARKKLIADD